MRTFSKSILWTPCTYWLRILNLFSLHRREWSAGRHLQVGQLPHGGPRHEVQPLPGGPPAPGCTYNQASFCLREVPKILQLRQDWAIEKERRHAATQCKFIGPFLIYCNIFLVRRKFWQYKFDKRTIWSIRNLWNVYCALSIAIKTELMTNDVIIAYDCTTKCNTCTQRIL